MKLVSYLGDTGEERAGLLVGANVVDLREGGKALSSDVPRTMLELLEGGDRLFDRVRNLDIAAQHDRVKGIPLKGTRLLAPVPHPRSCRDAYAFRQHVATARRNRGLEMIPEFDEFPVFYFTNHNSIVGPGQLVVESDHLEQLDFELEAAILIGKKGRNVQVTHADSYIAGYMIMNDFSARKLQMEEMKLSLGPAKGKDFATALGPWLVTPDELEDRRSRSKAGNAFDLDMKAFHNGRQVSSGNLKDMNWTFAEIIERVSYGVDIYPGDVIGSGTVGTGCYLELNGTAAAKAKESGEEYTPVWLQAGDTIELEISGLGRLSNSIKRAKEQRSILSRKKMRRGGVTVR
jgi:fumarylacetoacetate (FAA) hydrolase